MSLFSKTRAVLAALCLVAPSHVSDLSAQTVTGMVFEEGSGIPVTGASISVLDSDFQTRIQSLLTDAMGRFRLVLPDSGAYIVTASRNGYVASSPEVVVLGLGEAVTVMLSLRSIRPDTVSVAARRAEGGGYTADVYGQVLDNDGGSPIQNAEVQFIGMGGVTTGSNGRFFIRDLPPGPARIYFQHLTFVPRETHINLEPGVAYEVVVRLDPDPVEIPGIEVSAVSRVVARRLEPVYARMDRAVTAHFRTEADFAAQGHPSVGNLLRGIPRVRVQNRGSAWVVTMGGAVSVTGEACVPTVYMDGVRVSQHGDQTSLSEFMNMPTFDMAVIEVYPGAAALPPELNDPGTMCAIGIWTKRGGGG